MRRAVKDLPQQPKQCNTHLVSTIAEGVALSEISLPSRAWKIFRAPKLHGPAQQKFSKSSILKTARTSNIKMATISEGGAPALSGGHILQSPAKTRTLIWPDPKAEYHFSFLVFMHESILHNHHHDYVSRVVGVVSKYRRVKHDE